MIENGRGRLVIVPLTLEVANRFVARLHRHHKPTVGHRFSLGVTDEQGLLHGVAIVGRPVARLLDDGWVVEVNRLCTDGTANACSSLYGACRRVAREMGFRQILTYILEEEPGTSLRASGWTLDVDFHGDAKGWNRPNRARYGKPLGVKARWSCTLHPTSFPATLVPQDPDSLQQLDLFTGTS